MHRPLSAITARRGSFCLLSRPSAVIRDRGAGWRTTTSSCQQVLKSPQLQPYPRTIPPYPAGCDGLGSPYKIADNPTFGYGYDTSPPLTFPDRMRLPLQGKTAFITGGSSGIGLGIGKRFLREGGRRVIIAGRDKLRLVQAMGELDEVIRGMRVEGTYANEPDEFSELMEDGGMGPMDLYEHGAGKGRVITPREGRPDGTYNGAGHGSASLNPLRETSEPVTPTSGPEISHFRHITLMIGDISKPAFWSSPAVSNILDRTDVLVNSAGLSQSAILPLAKEDDIEKMIDTNLRGTVLACRAFMKRVMRSTRTSTKRREIAGANEDGKSSIDDEAGQDKCILNVSSLHGVRPGIGATTYAATKAGVISLTHAIVNEAASLPRPLPLRANVLVPGYIQTKILEDISPEFLDKARRKIPAGRLGNVQEVADAAVFLVKNRYCNGTVLNIDGGLGSRAP